MAVKIAPRVFPDKETAKMLSTKRWQKYQYNIWRDFPYGSFADTATGEVGESSEIAFLHRNTESTVQCWRRALEREFPSRRRIVNRIFTGEFNIALLTDVKQDIIRELVPSFTSELRDLQQLYVFRMESEVIEFLERNPFLIPILKEAHGQIKKHFGQSTQVILELVPDPDVMAGEELVAFIRTHLSPDEALKRLDQLDEGWWLDASSKAFGKLCIHVE